MPASTATEMPSDAVEITRRDLRFALEDSDLRTWHRDGLHVAHFFNALSILFPEGETFFIDAVREFADKVRTPEVQADVEGFLGQEAMHSREHRRYNRALAAAGLPAADLEAEVVALLDFVRKVTTPGNRLGATIALEHFTAIMADVALDDEAVFGGSHPVLGSLWRWHAVEETEHKAVAFDVYREAVGEGGLAYTQRVVTMLLASLLLWVMVFQHHFRMVKADGALLDLRGWGRLFRYLWLSPGFLRKLAVPWLGYFRPGFHPWQRDNRELVERWKAEYAAAGHAPA